MAAVGRNLLIECFFYAAYGQGLSLTIEFVRFGQHDVYGFAGGKKPIQQFSIQCGEWAAAIHDAYQTRELIAGFQIRANQTFPLTANVAGCFGVAVSGQVDQIASGAVFTRIDAKIIEVLRTSGRFADEGQSGTVGQRIDGGRLAGIGATGEGNFKQGIIGRIAQLSHGVVKRGFAKK